MPKFLEKIHKEQKITRHGQTVQSTAKFRIPLQSRRIDVSFLLLKFEIRETLGAFLPTKEPFLRGHQGNESCLEFNFT